MHHEEYDKTAYADTTQYGRNVQNMIDGNLDTLWVFDGDVYGPSWDGTGTLDKDYLLDLALLKIASNS